MAKKKITIDKIDVKVSAVAIVSSEPLYRLCWLINQQLGWQLAESEKLNVINPAYNEMQGFFMFDWIEQGTENHYYIIQNKGAQGLFDTTIKYVDYWLRIEGDADIANLCIKLKTVKEIQMIQPVDRKKFEKSLVFRFPLIDNVAM